jgi:DNA-binding GntR family transcriptional regulator
MLYLAGIRAGAESRQEDPTVGAESDSSRSSTVGLGKLAPYRGGQATPRGAMPHAVADALREAILDGALPPGTWLREAEVSRELEVSRTPVRDAFRILASEGLVDINANQGAVVSRMTSDDILELYAVRGALETLAARLAARRAPERCTMEFARLLPKMKQAAADNDPAALLELNYQFHTTIRDATSNRYLQRSLTQLQNAARRFPDATLTLPGRIAESQAEHLAIAEAISRGDVDAAANLAAHHWQHLSELRIRMLLNS